MPSTAAVSTDTIATPAASAVLMRDNENDDVNIEIDLEDEDEDVLIINSAAAAVTMVRNPKQKPVDPKSPSMTNIVRINFAVASYQQIGVIGQSHARSNMSSPPMSPFSSPFVPTQAW